jgi:hypothetical protein
MKTSYPYTERIPEWAMCYIINGDRDTVTDEEIEMINKYLERNNACDVDPKCWNNGEEWDPYFTTVPAFGLACNVVDCYLIYND